MGKDIKGLKQKHFSGTPGLISGILFIIIGILIFTQNEKNVIRKQLSFKKGSASVLPVSSGNLNPENNNHLIYINGLATPASPVKDEDFGISVDVIHLKRKVEIFQWVEKAETIKEKDHKKSEKITYSKTWKAGLVSSSGFREPLGHINPEKVDHTSKWFIADEVRVGAFKLSEAFVNKITKESPLLLDTLNSLEPDIKTRIKNNMIYLGSEQDLNPEIGDVRISYSIIKPQNISLIGKQKGKFIDTYVTSKGQKINILEHGLVEADKMFAGEIKSGINKNWIFRGISFLMIFLGFTLIHHPVKTISGTSKILYPFHKNRNIKFSILFSILIIAFIIVLLWLLYDTLIGVSGILVLILSFLLLFMGQKQTKPTN